MRSDKRAIEISEYLKSGKMSPDAKKCLSYLISRIEAQGELEIFVSEEIDQCRADFLSNECVSNIDSNQDL